jgi:hypothetical protein
MRPQSNILSEDDFVQIEHKHAVKICSDERQKLNALLRRYAMQKEMIAEIFSRGQKESSAASQIKKAVSATNRFRATYPHAFRQRIEGRDAEIQNALGVLERLGDRCAAHGNDGSRPPDHFVGQLLFGLEEIFVRSDGQATGVSRGMDARHGKFVAFADALLAKLPETCRPRSSIASQWERLRSSRKSGAIEINLFLEGVFNVKYTRSPRPGKKAQA